MSYTIQENLVISYIASFFEKSDFKFLAPLVRDEFNNKRSVQAYISRIYKVANENPALIEKHNVFNILNIKNSLLYSCLKPNDEEKETEQQNEIQSLKNELKSLKDDIIFLKTSLQNFKKEKKEEKKEEDEDVYKIVDDIFQKAMQEELPIQPDVKAVLDDSLLKYLDDVDKETIPKTIEEWKEQQTQEKPKQYYCVKSASKDKIGWSGFPIYKVKYSERDNSYYCECPAWKYQHLHPKHRTCKHILAIRGEEAEKARIESNDGIYLTQSERYKKVKKVKKVKKLVI